MKKKESFRAPSILTRQNNITSRIGGENTSLNIMTLLEAQVTKTPNDVAISFEGSSFTYQQLNEQANKFANHLIANGAKLGMPIPIIIERSIEMIVGILGILKAGAAYVPIDPTSPSAYIEFILEDTDATILLCSHHSRSVILQQQNFSIIEVDGNWQQYDSIVVAGELLPDQLAYIIYTSGSSGFPKGVMVEHGNLFESATARKKYYPSMRTTLLVPPFSFDASVAAIFGCLITGGNLLLCKTADIKDPFALRRLLQHTHTLLCVPSFYRFLLEDGIVGESALTIVILGGEKLDQNLVDEHFYKTENIFLYNEYGPTEATVWATVAAIKKGDEIISIGKPVGNVAVYIVDDRMTLVPQGTVGELFIGGGQVARGYKNLPELTQQKFINNPFDTTSERIYKTGDTARLLPDGNIEYLGRIDDQVKIDGYRIEPGAIEKILAAHAGIKQAIVTAKEIQPGVTKLIAHIITDGEFNKENTVQWLHSKVPAYMIPAFWVEVKNFPLTPNGKIDKLRLQYPEINSLSAEKYEAPVSSLEKGIAGMWKQILKIERVSRYDNFFYLGGNSLLAMKFASLIKKNLNQSISVNDIFIHPTLFAFCLFLEGSTNEKTKLKYLIPLKPAGNKNPIYIVAGGGGTALQFKGLAEQLDVNQPVFVFQLPADRKHNENFPVSVELLAAKFIEEISIQNPDGPYALAGHCLGGIIAFEMARQLILKGKEITMLAMFDVILGEILTPQNSRLIKEGTLPVFIKRLTAKVLLKVSFETYLLKNHLKQAVIYKADRIKRGLQYAVGKLSGYSIQANSQAHIISAHNYMAICNQYKLAYIDIDLILFYAKERYYFTDVKNNIRFKKIAVDEESKVALKKHAKRITIYDITGDHSNIFEFEKSKEFATVLQIKLETTNSLVQV